MTPRGPSSTPKEKAMSVEDLYSFALAAEQDEHAEEQQHEHHHSRHHSGHQQQTQQQQQQQQQGHHHRHQHTSSSSGGGMHRVNTTGHLDDYYSGAKQLSRSARERLVKRFSVRKSTEENHSLSVDDDEVGFYGAYGNVRQKLDYHYHVHYRKERQWLHDAIIEDCLLEHQHDDWSHQEMTTVLPRTPWLIIMAGAHGAGKHNVIRELVNSERLPLLSYVCVDTDDLRRYLPEYSTYLQESPDKVDRLTRKEAGFISETLSLAALQAGRNVIFHCSLKDHQWYKDDFIPSFRKQFHKLKMALFHVTADLDVVLQRARKRANDTGRTICEGELEATLTELVPRACQILQPEVDFFCTIRNNGGAVELLEIGGGSSSSSSEADWSTFTSTFDQRGSILSLSYPEDLPGLVCKPSGALRRTSSLHRRFSAVQSSEANHATDDFEFYGPFAEIRKALDYTYHSNYNFERQVFQDAIIREFLDAAVVQDRNGEVCTTPTQPWAVFSAGAMGAGKGYTISRLVEKGRFPLMAFVRVNPDAIRRYLPEYHLYIETNPDMAGSLTNKEAGYIAEILTLAGLQRGKNVLVDGSLRQADWYRDYFAMLRKEFPNLRLAIIHIVAPREAIFKRAAERALQTGRIVPRALLAETIDEVPRSVCELAPLVDYHVELMNDAAAPDIEIVTPGETWETFTANWIQICRFVPKNQHRLHEKSKRIEENMGCTLKS